MGKYKGKKVLIVGFGLSGVAVAKYMAKQGAKITVTDMKQKNELQESINACGDIKIEWELGKHNNKTFHAAELIVVSPGVPPNIEAARRGARKADSDHQRNRARCQALKEPLIAITGTNGKTTVTTLIGEMFKADEKPAYVGGNIGKPLLDYVTDGQKAEYVIAEISSFQLEITEKLTPAVAVFTNLEARSFGSLSGHGVLHRRPRSAFSSSAIATASSF